MCGDVHMYYFNVTLELFEIIKKVENKKNSLEYFK